MKIFIITALLVISYVAASPMSAEDEEFDGLLDRVARATQKQRRKEAKDHWKNSCNSKGRAIQSSDVKCPKGKKAVIEKDENGDMVELRCVNCEDGKYTFTKGLFGSCCDCPEGKSTIGGQAAICDELCPPGKGRGNNGKCALCDDDTYNDGDSLECKPCPDFHKVKKSEMKKAQRAATKSECKLDKCPDGFIKTPDDSCKPCGHGNYSKGDKCMSCDKNEPFTLSNANKGAKACFALDDSAERDCYHYMFKTLKEYGPKMNEGKKEKDEEMEDEEDPDEGGRPTGSGGATGSGDGSRPTGGGGGPPAERKKRAVAKDEEKTTEDNTPEKGKRAKAKEEKEKKEKQARGKSLRSAICKGKGSLDELKAKYKACKALEESTGKKLMPEFAKFKDAKKVGVKDILEKEEGREATCEDVEEDDECVARTGSGRQSGSASGHSGSGSGHSGSGSGHSGSGSGHSGSGSGHSGSGSGHSGSGSGHSGSGSGHSGSGSGHSGSGSGTPPPPPPQGGETGGTKPGSGGPLRR